MKSIVFVAVAAVGLICTTGVTFADTILPAETAAQNVESIQEAIDAAAILPEPGTVTLGEGLFEIDVQLMVTGGVTLVGQGWDKTILKQVATTPTADTRVVQIDGGATVKHVTLTGGVVNRPGGWSWGAGAFVANGTISWCCITNNTSGVVTTANNYGGGVGFGDGKGRIDHSIVMDNSVVGLQTSFGGGIAIRHPTGTVEIDTCLISGNLVFNKQESTGAVTDGGGAGIVIEHTTTSQNFAMTVRNSTIAGNATDDGLSSHSIGGAVYTRNDGGDKFSMVNCIIAGNTSASTNTTVALDYTGGVDYCLFDVNEDKVGEHSLFGDPKFVQPEEDDYRLDLNSPAVGEGETYEGLGKDLANADFSNTPSMGCYEYANLAAKPTVDVESGVTFYPTTNVTLSCATGGATIYYTTDGSRPTASSTPYTGPIEISATTTIKARAYAQDLGPSGIATATYTCKRPTPKPTDFAKSVEITLTTGLASIDITNGIPALVKLSESTINGFDYDDFMLENGGDMMFFDANGNPIPHEVDTWNEDGESLVWVKLPSTAASTTITMYYGNGVVPTEAPEDVWSGYVGVWHLNEADGNAKDSTGHGLVAVPTGDDAVSNSVGVACQVGNGRQMATAQGQKAYLSVADNALLDCGDTLTFSGWYKATATFPNYSMRYVSRKNAYGDPNGWEAEALYSTNPDNSAKMIAARGADSAGGHQTSVPDIRESWVHLAIVYDGTELVFYVDGLKKGPIAMSGTTATDNDLPLAFGNNAAGNEANWVGFMDELRLSADARSADYAIAEYKAMNSTDTDIFSYGYAQDVGDNVIRPSGDATGIADARAIQAAIDAAVPTQGTVVLGDGVFEINAQLNVTGGVTLVGQGWTNTVIKQVAVPNYGENARCVMIDDGATVEGLALTGGTIKKSNDGGAGAWVKNGTISWCCITNNVGAENNVYGIGVSFSDGQGTIDHSIIADNKPIAGGGYYGGGVGALNTVGPVLIDTCLVANNSLGSNSAGGGIGIKGEQLDCVIRNCTVAGNVGSLHAGGIRLEMTSSNHGSAVILNTIAVGNTLNGNESNYAVNTDTIGITGSGNCFFGLESEANSIPDSLFGNPKFIDASNGNYRLLTNSEAANAGVSYSGIGVDLDNALFAAVPSIGCYEYDPNAQPPAGEWDIPGGGSGGGGIKGLDDGDGIKYVTFTAIERVGSDVAVEFHAAEIGASVGASFGLICKDNLADTGTFTLDALLTAVDTTHVLGTLKAQTNKTQLFVVGIGPASAQ
ncbi:MAG: DUF2341 domain-containing protein [Kiritimatiellae bacterium]|nr:DUF2341 domain-containing protein [Kiritimatiellia bacterium]